MSTPSTIYSLTDAIDPRLKQLSYSTLLSLHTCPRKFELYKLKANRTEETSSQSVTFAFGSCVGLGIQSLLAGKTKEETMWDMFLEWEAPLLAANEKQMKSFAHAVLAVEKFDALRSYADFLDGYEILVTERGPAVELSFSITFPDGFVYRGFVDAVLRHKVTGEILVLEIKTSSGSNVNPAMYKNSAQAIGYSIVLDSLIPGLSRYDVQYLVYKTKSQEYEPYRFPKTFAQKALWIQETLLDIETIKLYASAGVYPMRGESCFSFFSECEYYSTCNLSNQFTTVPVSQDALDYIAEDHAKYEIKLSLLDLLETQLGATS